MPSRRRPRRDHIYASALATRMQLGRRHHTDRWRVNSVGNLWLLDARVNRALQKTGPREKFKKLREWREAHDASHAVWPDAQWALTPEDQTAFSAAADALAALPVDAAQRAPALDEAMQAFTAIVHGRALGLIEQVMADLPEVVRFARLAEDGSDNAADLEPLEVRTVDSETITTAQKRLGINAVGARSLADKWQDRANEVEWAFKDATSRQSRRTEPARRNAPRIWHHSDPGRSGFAYFREIPFGFAAPPSYFRAGYSEWFDPSALLWFLIEPDQRAHAGAAEALRSAGLRCTSDERGLRVPIDLRFHLHWSELARDIDAQLAEIRRALDDPCLTVPPSG